MTIRFGRCSLWALPSVPLWEYGYGDLLSCSSCKLVASSCRKASCNQNNDHLLVETTTWLGLTRLYKEHLVLYSLLHCFVVIYPSYSL